MQYKAQKAFTVIIETGLTMDRAQSSMKEIQLNLSPHQRCKFRKQENEPMYTGHWQVSGHLLSILCQTENGTLARIQIITLNLQKKERVSQRLHG